MSKVVGECPCRCFYSAHLEVLPVLLVAVMLCKYLTTRMVFLLLRPAGEAEIHRGSRPEALLPRNPVIDLHIPRSEQLPQLALQACSRIVASIL